MQESKQEVKKPVLLSSKYLDRQIWAKKVDPGQTLQNMASDRKTVGDSSSNLIKF